VYSLPKKSKVAGGILHVHRIVSTVIEISDRHTGGSHWWMSSIWTSESIEFHQLLLS